MSEANSLGETSDISDLYDQVVKLCGRDMMEHALHRGKSVKKGSSCYWNWYLLYFCSSSSSSSYYYYYYYSTLLNLRPVLSFDLTFM